MSSMKEQKKKKEGSGQQNVRDRFYKPCSHFSLKLRAMERHRKDLRSEVIQTGMYF